MRCSDFRTLVSLRFGCPLALRYRRSSRRKRSDLPGSWGTFCAHALTENPGGSALRLTLRMPSLGESLLPTSSVPHSSLRSLSLRLAALGCCLSPIRGFRLPQLRIISGLNVTACSLAVYASQLSFPVSQSYGHARLASGWWSALSGRDCLPTRSPVKFLLVYFASSSPRLCLAQLIPIRILAPVADSDPDAASSGS